jgi:hypothetical protein
MTVAELRDALDRHEPVTIIDVRPADQYAEWSIPGSQHIDAYERLKAGDRRAGRGRGSRQPARDRCLRGWAREYVRGRPSP